MNTPAVPSPTAIQPSIASATLNHLRATDVSTMTVIPRLPPREWRLSACVAAATMGPASGRVNDRRRIGVRTHQIPFFKLNGHKDVRRGHRRKQQVRDGHRRRAPERKQPSHIQRVPHDAVQALE